MQILPIFKSWKKILMLYIVVLAFTHSINFSIDILWSYDAYFNQDFLFYMKVNVPIITITVLFNVFFVFYINNTFLRKNYFLRFFLDAIFASFSCITQILMSHLFFDLHQNIIEHIQYMFVSNYIYTNAVENYISLLFTEFLYFVYQSQQDEVKFERIMVDNEKYKYNQLKSQLDPHFLFNSLSVSISLIKRDQEKAVEYIKKLSLIYRYVLTKNEDDFVCLEEELIFIKKYIEILQIRFEKGFDVVFEIEDSVLKKKIVPMSLQLLLENAVKHNSIFEDNPLTILIYTKEDKIVVENNINKKSIKADSIGVGLRNLDGKYTILTSKSIDIINNNDKFVVQIPLI